jgi:hypothetical protein
VYVYMYITVICPILKRSSGVSAVSFSRLLRHPCIQLLLPATELAVGNLIEQHNTMNVLKLNYLIGEINLTRSLSLTEAC